MKKAAFLVLIGFLLAIADGCVVSPPRIAPPPLRVEVLSARPGPHFVWIGGCWRWNGNTYIWAPGHWVNARPGKAWVPGHWERRGPHWVWKNGHWR